MYLAHFQLQDQPFRLTPDLAYRYRAMSQVEALRTLRLALSQGAGFIKVIGEVGLGKTMMCRTLLESLKPPYVTAWLPDPHVSPGTLRMAIARDFGIPLPSRPTQQQVQHLLQQHLTRMVADGKRPVLLIDEAQALPDNALETVRLLTNLETERRKLLQVVLFGQPELDRRLATRAFRQLRQRIAYSARIRPLDRPGVEHYIEHRLKAAGARYVPFTHRAITRIARASGGVPRIVNILCEKALLAAFGRGKSHAGWREAGRAIADTEAVHSVRHWWPRLQPVLQVLAFALVALGIYWFLDFYRGGGA